MDTLISRRSHWLPTLTLAAAMMWATPAIQAAPVELTQASIADLDSAKDDGKGHAPGPTGTILKLSHLQRRT